MISREDLEEYRNKFVIVGIPHTSDKNRLFYHQGNLKDLDDNSVTLTTRDGIEVISISDIRHFKVSGKKNE